MTNKQLIAKFYEAFNRKDFETMNSCYAEDIVFSDPLFGFLQGDEVRALWKMLCKNAKNFTISFDEITEIDHEYITCKWVAVYTFNETGRKVVNKAKAFMRINDGKIVEHSDGFNMNTWLKQAFGWKGKLFGWTNFMKQKVHKKALKSLKDFMNNSR